MKKILAGFAGGGLSAADPANAPLFKHEISSTKSATKRTNDRLLSSTRLSDFQLFFYDN
ncbi:MAG: hypothetical protein NTW21_37280 [Verrucomicrobia bacterium]|nr:hypothetical protein [Verrucomicrobiota bacterium]